MLLLEQILFGYCYTRFILSHYKIFDHLAHTKHKSSVPYSCISAADPGEGPWWPTLPPPHLFLDQTEAQKAAKRLFFFSPPPPPPPPSYLKVWICHCIWPRPPDPGHFWNRILSYPGSFVWMWPNALNQFRERFQKDEVLERYILTYIHTHCIIFP